MKATLAELASGIVMHERLRAMRFAGVGVVSTVIDLVVFLLLEGFGLWLAAANILAFLCANVFSFLANATFTFNTKGQRPQRSFSSYGKFFLVHLFGLAAATALLLILAPSIGVLSAKGVSVIASYVVNYFLTSKFVFTDAKGERAN